MLGSCQVHKLCGNHVGGSYLCHVKLRVYNYMAQPEPDPFFSRVKMAILTVNPNLIILCWLCVDFTGYMVIHVGMSNSFCVKLRV